MSNSTIKQIRVQINGAWTVLDYNSSSGKYEKTITAPSITSYNVNSNHYYPIIVEATDLAGNVTTKTDSDSILGNNLKLKVKEKTAPVISISQPTASSYVTSNVFPIKFTINDESNGSGVNPESIRLTIDSDTYTKTSTGISFTPISSTRGYSVIYTPPVGLSDGVHTLKINASDYDGNNADQLSITYTVDTVSPQLLISQPNTNGIYVNNPAYTVSGVTSDITSGISFVNVKVNGIDIGNASIDNSGNFTKNISLIEGANSIAVKAVDRAGKFTEVIRTINLDTIAPSIISVNISPNPVNTGQSYVISVAAND